ncbi:MAG TPA: hypothetical protein VIW03_14795, partial [Anaeromyxobacter sp.]
MMTPLAADAAFEAGRRVGSAVWVLIFLALLVRQLRRLRAQGPNRKGVWSGLLAYGGIASMQGLNMATGVLPAAAKIALPALVFVALLVGTILGIQAIGEVRAARRAGGAADSGGAGWGVGLSIFTMIAMGVGFGIGVADRAGVPAELRAAAPAAPVRNESLNFAFEPPPAFVPLEAKKLNPMAALAYGRPGPQVFFMIIAESGIDLSSEEVVNVAETNLKAASPDASVLERGPHTVNGLAGFRLRSVAKRGNAEFAFVHWTFGAKGFAYQLVTWGAAADAAAVA